MGDIERSLPRPRNGSVPAVRANTRGIGTAGAHRRSTARHRVRGKAKPAAVERWSQPEAEVVDDDDPAELMERARQHFKRSILADASEQNLSGSSGSPTPSAVMTAGAHRLLADGWVWRHFGLLWARWPAATVRNKGARFQE